MLSIILYIVAIVMANILTATLTPSTIGPFIITAGTWFVGATFFLRDMAQERYGRSTMYKVIGAALILSGVFSIMNGDILAITFASALAFGVSESTDTEIYTRLKLPIEYRVLWSGVAGGFLDSAVFVVVGLSPLTIGIIPWGAVPVAIMGQVIVKTIMQIAGMGAVKLTINYRQGGISP
jgi:uncharacterized PurR-regulated membrane protein YhhQ (DUF165 family)